MKKRRTDILSKATDEGSIGYRESITGNCWTPVSVWSRRNLLLLPCGSYPLKDMTLIARSWRTRWCTTRVDDLCDARPFEEWRENHNEIKREREKKGSRQKELWLPETSVSSSSSSKTTTTTFVSRTCIAGGSNSSMISPSFSHIGIAGGIPLAGKRLSDG